MTYVPTKSPISLTQLRHPTTLAKIITAWEDVLTVSTSRKSRAVRYVLDRKGKEWIRMEKSPGSPIVVTFRGYGATDQSSIIRQLLEVEGVTFDLLEVESPTLMSKIKSFLRSVYQ